MGSTAFLLPGAPGLQPGAASSGTRAPCPMAWRALSQDDSNLLQWRVQNMGQGALGRAQGRIDQLYCLTTQSIILPICFKEIAIQYTFSNSNNMISQFSDFTLTIRVRVPYEENSITSLRPCKMWAFCSVNKIFFARVMLQPKEEKLCVSFLFFF